MSTLPATRLPQYAIETVICNASAIRPFARLTSTVLTEACKQRGLPPGLSALCGSVLASVVDDLIVISRLARTDFERTKRKQRVLATANEPVVSALRLAIAASPVNGKAAIEHWDVICEQHEVGKLAWLLGVQTETAMRYSKKVQKRS